MQATKIRTNRENLLLGLLEWLQKNLCALSVMLTLGLMISQPVDAAAPPGGQHVVGAAGTGATTFGGCTACHSVSTAGGFMTGLTTPNSPLSYYAQKPGNFTLGLAVTSPNNVPASSMGAIATVGSYSNTTAANQNDLSAYFATFVTPSLATPASVSLTAASYAYSYQIVASSAAADYLVDTTTYSGSGLPPGITVDLNSGLVSGTAVPTATPTTYTVTLSATQTNNTTAGSTSYTIAVNGTQTIVLGTAPTVNVGTTGTVSVTSKGGSTSAVTFAASGGGCSVNASTGVVTGTAAGTNNCTITANQAAQGLYDAASPTTSTFSIGKASQTISFSPAPTLVYQGTATASASASSGLTVSFGTSTPTVCSVNSATGLVTASTGVAAGSVCTVTADQAGNGNYSAATQATQNITITKSNQTLSFGVTPTLAYLGSATAGATATSGLTVTYGTSTSTVCSVTSAGAITGLAGGGATSVCTVTANQAGDGNYNAATQVTQNVTITKANQSISFTTVPSISIGGTGTIVATSTSGLAVAYSSLTAGTCTVNTGTGLVTGGTTAGTNNCTIAADQAGNTNYNAATQGTQLISIGKLSQTITFGAAPAISYQGTGSVSATASSGLTASYTSLTPSVCSVTGGTVSGSAGGTCTIAANQSGDASYSAAPQVTQSFTISAIPQTLSFGAVPAVPVGGTGNVSVTATSGLTSFTYNASGNCSVNASGVVTGTAFGTNNCTVTVTQAGNGNYSSVQGSQVISIGKGSQTINVGAAPTVQYGGTGTVSATATSGLAVNFTSQTKTACTVNSTTGVVNGLVAGTNNCTIAFDQAGDINYNAAAQVTQTISIGQIGQSISLGTAPSLSAGITATLSGTASSGLTITFGTTTPTVCSVSGNTVRGLAIGSCVITADQSGNGNYTAATRVTQSITVGQGSQVITFGTAPTVYVGSTAAINASSSSGLGITFTSLTPSVCTVSGSTVTGVVAGTCTIVANQAGDANYKAASPVNLTFSVTYLPPSVAPASMSTQLNTTSPPLDMTPYVTGLAVSGIGVSTQPLHGTASVSGMKVTYTPAKDYFGTDTFKVVAYNPGGPSATPATVTVTISGRPDPLKDARVTGLINAETASIKRFGMVQVFNFQQRLESRHHAVYSPSNIGVPPQSGDAPSGGTPAPAGGPSPGGQQGRGYFNSWQPGTVLAYANDPNVLLHSTQFGGNAQAAGSDPMYGVLMNAMAGALTNYTLNLGTVSTVANSAMPNDEFGRLEVWAAGNLRFGTRSQSGFESKFTTDGISVGADKRVDRKLTLGMGMGYARDKSDIGSDGTNSNATGTSVAGYASYMMDSGNFLDVLLGYGRVNFSTNRFVTAVSDFARSTRSGDQLFGSLAFGYELRKESLLWSPYGRFDFSYDRLNAGTESGAGINALSYASQNLRSSHLAFGMRAQSVHQTDFGVVQPHARLEYQRGFETNGQTSVAYADMLDTQYIVAGTSQSSNALMLGFGNTLVLNDTMRLTLDYQRLRSRGLENYQSVSLRFTKTIKGKNDLASLLEEGYDASIAKTTGLTAIGSFGFDDNVSRASEKTDKRSDTVYGLTVNKALSFLPAKYIRLTASGFLDVEKFRRYAGLDRVSVGAQGEIAYRFSGDFGSPTIGFFARYTSDAYESMLRDGARRSVGVNLRKSLTDRINLFAALADNVRTGKSDVFNTRDKSGRLNVDYALATGQTLYLTGEYRKGDIVSSGQPSLSILDSSIVFVRDDVFAAPWFYDYRMKGRTGLFTLGYNFALGNRDSLDFSWRHVKSTPDKVPSFGGSPQYIDNLFSVSYLMAF